jgi:hypothetical protein
MDEVKPVIISRTQIFAHKFSNKYLWNIMLQNLSIFSYGTTNKKTLFIYIENGE